MTTGRSLWRSRIVWAGVGLAAGFAGGLIVGFAAAGYLSAPLLGSVAGCSAAIIAAAALTWNVYNGRLERQERQAAAGRAEQDRADQAEREQQAGQRALVEEAALITVELFGGGGYGHGDTLTGTTIGLRLINGATKPVTRLSFECEPQIELKDLRSVPGSLSPGEHAFLTLETHGYPLPRDQASHARLSSYQCAIVYSLGGRSWRRVEDELPTEVPRDEPARRAPLGAGS